MPNNNPYYKVYVIPNFLRNIKLMNQKRAFQRVYAFKTQQK